MVMPLGDSARTRIIPFATYLIIALNVVMFFVQSNRGEQFTTAYAATPFEITHNEDITEPIVLQSPGDDQPFRKVDRRATVIPQAPVAMPVWLTLFTSMFLHGSLMHLAGNMLFLWIFGDNVEEVLGAPRYVIAYLCCGLAGSLLQIAASPNSLIPTLGASGAIAGVMGMYVVWFPYNRVRVLLGNILTEVPAIMVIGVWIAIQVWQGFGSLSRTGHSGGVAYLAHVGGAAAGIGIAWLFRGAALRFEQPGWSDRVIG